jgi:uncharacterized membrane protein YozB (DUF420 family)
MSHETLPPINALLNGIATVLLVSAYLLVKRRNYRAHATLMISAFVVSCVFLVFYLWHKTLLYEATGKANVSVAHLGPAWLRYLYWFVLLIPHLILAVVMLPMILATFWRAYRRRWVAHRRLAKPTLWIWLYVSVTGVVIYWVLYHLFPRLNPGA